MVPPSGLSSGPVHRQTVPRTRLRPDLPRKICPSRGADKSPSRKQGPGAHTLAEGTRDPRQGRPASLKAETGHPLGPGSHSLAEGPRDPRQDRPASLKAETGHPLGQGSHSLAEGARDPRQDQPASLKAETGRPPGQGAPLSRQRSQRPSSGSTGFPRGKRRDTLSVRSPHTLAEGTRDPRQGQPASLKAETGRPLWAGRTQSRRRNQRPRVQGRPASLKAETRRLPGEARTFPTVRPVLGSRPPPNGPSDSSRTPPTSEDLTISWRRQILQSWAESQRIAVRKLLNHLQHPGCYASRLQTIRCGYTVHGGYGIWEDDAGFSPAPPDFPLHGLPRTARGRPLILPPSTNRTRYRCNV